MNETRYEVWYQKEKELARPCEIPDESGKTMINGIEYRPIIVQGAAVLVPSDWLHPVEPEIAPGTPCYGWSDPDDQRMVGFYLGRDDEGTEHELSVWSGGGNIYRVDHVEPIVQQPEIDWSKIADVYGGVAVMESGRVLAVFSTQHKPGENYELRDNFVRIIPRPQS